MQLKQHIVLLLGCLIAPMILIGQESGEPEVKKGMDNTLFILMEQTTPSLTFERRFIKTSKFFFVGRVGILAKYEEDGDISPGYSVEIGLVMGRKTHYIESGLKYYKITPQDPEGRDFSSGFQGAFMGYRLVLPTKYKMAFRIGVSIGASFEHNEDEVRHEFSNNEMYIGLGYRF